MTKDEYEAAGLHMCDHCGRLYETEAALLYCCNPTFDKPTYVRSYDE